MGKRLTKLSWGIVLFSLFGFFLFYGTLHYLFSLSLFNKNSLETLVYYYQKHTIWNTINHPYFWKSSIGVPLKLMIEILVVTFLVNIGTYYSQIKVSFKTLLFVTTACYILFLMELAGEVIYIKQFMTELELQHLESFSLFSISYFIQKFGFGVPYYLKHMFQTINLFELGLWFLMAFCISQIASVPFKKSFSAVGFYIFILFIWLLVISIITLIV